MNPSSRDDNMAPSDYEMQPESPREENCRVVYVPASPYSAKAQVEQRAVAQQRHKQLELHLQQRQQQIERLQQEYLHEQRQAAFQQQMQHMQQQQLQQQQFYPPGQISPSHYPSQSAYPVKVVYRYLPYPPVQQQGTEPYWTYAPSSALYKKSTPSIVPHENDVLMGRGGKNNLHVGNEKLRKMARTHREEYIKSTKKEKSALSRRLVKKVQAMTPPGRFLRKNRITSSWEEVDCEYAREKASQCLRDAVTEGPSPVNEDASGKDDQDDDASMQDERASTPEPFSGQKREESPVITPENSPRTKRRSSVKVGDLSIPLPLGASSNNSSHSQPQTRSKCGSGFVRTPPRRATSDTKLQSSRAEGKDNAVTDGDTWMREEIAFDKMRGHDDDSGTPDKMAEGSTSSENHQVSPSGLCRNRDDTGAAKGPGDYNDDGLDQSGHSHNPLPCSGSVPNFALFSEDVRDLLDEEADSPDKQQQSFSELHHVNEAFLAKSDDPIDLEAPLAMEEDLEVSMNSDPTGQTEEILVMLTDPFGSDFF